MAAPRGPDAAIKLFGRTIALPDSTGAAAEVSTELADDRKINYGTKCMPDKLLNVKPSSFCSKDSSLNGTQSVNSQNAKMETHPKPEEVKTESDGSGQEKELKRPDKILPCPRCDSMETKFCYFNNYNVNQPRHYCRSCKRYWTAGGTMRNVPIGTGRRRNKHTSHHHHAMMSCDGNVSNGDASDATHQQSLPVGPHVLQGTVGENQKVTKSGSNVVFCNSKVPVLNAKEKNNSLGSVDNKEEKSCATSSTASGCSENWMPENTITKEQNNILGMGSGVEKTHPHIMSYPAGPTLVVPWNPGWNCATGMASTQCSTESVRSMENGTGSKVSLLQPIMMPTPTVPFPLVSPLWSSIHGWPNGVGNSPWPANNGTTLPSPHSIACSGNSSPKLGKHSREETLRVEAKKGNNVCVPKILRITNPEDAAKSSILASLGIKPDEKSIFKSFQSDVLEGCKTPDPPQAQQANPAAVSRSLSFQERM